MYSSKWYIMTYADNSGSMQLDVSYGNEHDDGHGLLAYLNGYPAMAVYNGVVYLTHQASLTDHALWHMTYDGTNWSFDTTIPNVYLNESPGMAVFNGNLYVAHQGSDTTGAANSLWYTVTNGRAWSQDKNIPGIQMNGSPAMAVFNDTLYLFFRGIDGSTLWYTTTTDGKTWPNQWQVDGVSMRNSPSAAVRDGVLYVAYHNSDDGTICYSTYDGNSERNWSPPATIEMTTTLPIADKGSPAIYLDDTNNYLMLAYTYPSGFQNLISVVPPQPTIDGD
ncbi:hypothetical protein RO07_25290 [Pandoraea pulmonicola]|nr:hypothetical protein RO07_25290 [Pandoraea pulmonicola]